MGYCIHLREAVFTIPASKVADALEAVMNGKGSYESPQHYIGKIKNYKHLPPALKLSELVDQTWGFSLKPNENGGIQGIEWEWEKSHNENEVMMLLGPFVDAGCYVEMGGEDGAAWRYIFDGKTCVEKEAKLVWE